LFELSCSASILPFDLPKLESAVAGALSG